MDEQRFDALMQRLAGIEQRLGRLEERLERRAGMLRGVVDAIRSDLTTVALAVAVDR